MPRMRISHLCRTYTAASARAWARAGAGAGKAEDHRFGEGPPPPPHSALRVIPDSPQRTGALQEAVLSRGLPATRLRTHPQYTPPSAKKLSAEDLESSVARSVAVVGGAPRVVSGRERPPAQGRPWPATRRT